MNTCLSLWAFSKEQAPQRHACNIVCLTFVFITNVKYMWCKSKISYAWNIECLIFVFITNVKYMWCKSKILFFRQKEGPNNREVFLLLGGTRLNHTVVTLSIPYSHPLLLCFLFGSFVPSIAVVLFVWYFVLPFSFLQNFVLLNFYNRYKHLVK